MNEWAAASWILVYFTKWLPPWGHWWPISYILIYHTKWRELMNKRLWQHFLYPCHSLQWSGPYIVWAILVLLLFWSKDLYISKNHSAGLRGLQRFQYDNLQRVAKLTCLFLGTWDHVHNKYGIYCPDRPWRCLCHHCPLGEGDCLPKSGGYNLVCPVQALCPLTSQWPPPPPPKSKKEKNIVGYQLALFRSVIERCVPGVAGA